jgi:hypothetical protein
MLTINFYLGWSESVGVAYNRSAPRCESGSQRGAVYISQLQQLIDYGTGVSTTTLLLRSVDEVARWRSAKALL